jgi:hypothetical protein
MFVEQQRQPQPEGELDCAGDQRIEEGVEQRQLCHLVADQKGKILQADPMPSPPHLGVSEAEPDAQPEGIGEKDEQQGCCRQHERQAQGIGAVSQAGESVQGESSFRLSRKRVMRARVSREVQ